MTDSTYSYVTCRRLDASRFSALGYRAEDEDTEHDPDDIVELVDYCANYGNSVDLERTAREGLVFCASHEGGCEYGPCVQASDGTDYADVGSDGSGYPVARIMGDGKINRDDFRSARRYWGIHKRARAALGEVKDA